MTKFNNTIKLHISMENRTEIIAGNKSGNLGGFLNSLREGFTAELGIARRNPYESADTARSLQACVGIINAVEQYCEEEDLSITLNEKQRRQLLQVLRKADMRGAIDLIQCFKMPTAMEIAEAWDAITEVIRDKCLGIIGKR